MRRLARGYSIHLRSRAALIRRNDDFGIGMRRKAYPFGPFVRYEHFLRESCRRALIGQGGAQLLQGHVPAACRPDIPPAIAASTRSRKSSDSAFDIPAGPPAPAGSLNQIHPELGIPYDSL